MQAGVAMGPTAGKPEGGSASSVAVARPAGRVAARAALGANTATVTVASSMVTAFTEWGWQDFERFALACTDV